MPLNQCCVCGENFASLPAFDAHILSKPADAEFDCMQAFELRRHGWVTTGEVVGRAPNWPRR